MCRQVRVLQNVEIPIVAAVIGGVNELAMLRNAVDIPLLAEEGWTRHQ